jgi:hypothetical protein
MEHLICRSLKKSCRLIMGKGAYFYYFLAMRIYYKHHHVNCKPLFNSFWSRFHIVILGMTFWSRFYIVILGIAFFFVTFHLVSIFYLDFYFPFSIWTFVSLFYLDFYFFFRLFISFLDFYFFFWLLFPFLHKSRSDLGFLPSFFSSDNLLFPISIWTVFPLFYLDFY